MTEGDGDQVKKWLDNVMATVADFKHSRRDTGNAVYSKRPNDVITECWITGKWKLLN